MFPKKKWGQTPKSPTMVPVTPESALQIFADEFLGWAKTQNRMRAIRVPDAFWRWLAMNAPEHILKFMRGTFGGIPDDVILVPLNERYALALLLELKTEDAKGRAVGRLHGKQRRWAEDLPVQIARNSAQIEAAINQLLTDAKAYRDTLNPSQKERYGSTEETNARMGCGHGGPAAPGATAVRGGAENLPRDELRDNHDHQGHGASSV